MAILINLTNGDILARKVCRARTLWQRLVGFTLKPEILPDDGIWFDRCAIVHTVGVLRRIDVIFLDQTSRVLRVEPSVRRFRAIGCRGGHTVIELGEAQYARDLLVGDVLALRGD